MKYLRIEATGSDIPIPENYKDCVLLIQSDFYRYLGRRLNLFSMFIYTLKDPTLRFLFWHRLSSYKSKNPLYFISKVIHRHLEFKYALMIPSSTRIGFGFYIGKPTSIIINSSAIIGNNVNVSQFTTIGANEKNAALIGDNVYIGPSCCLIENVVIGSNSIIGAGSIVKHNVPENSVVAGNPAKEIKSKVFPGKYINNKWSIDK